MDALITGLLGRAYGVMPAWTRPILRWARVDFRPPRAPSGGRVALATVVAIVASLVADALLVRLGTTLYPSTRGYVHFAFFDYARLTVIGVVIAGVGWSLVARLTSSPEWLFARLAVAVSAVLLLPDAYILSVGSPLPAVFVLVWMHFAIALVTYASLTVLAPVARGRHAR
ncbi:MAG TPA: hypothetical protein PLS29_09850 [Acidimicrobiales bacterium]|nr:MAG: hypothetical protein B7Z69_03065 [Actinobacteria bacterium 21-73-9]HQU27317.1 hypothetical protein [Acidimicrobiales bacterium]